MSSSSHRRAKPTGRRAKQPGSREVEASETTRRFRPKSVFKWAGAVFGLGFAGTIVLCGVAYAMTEVPPVKELAQAQATVIEWRDGSELARIGAQNRLAVSLNEVPDHLEHAVIAAENGSFYDQPLGISPKGILRAAYTTLTTDQLAGGSTITQQYAQKAYLAEGRTLTVKFKELFLTLKLEQQLGKKEILRNYLNTIYFGRSSYGVEAASQAYFGKHVRDLNVSESAFIALVLNSPGSFDPQYGKEELQAAKGRWEYVIGRMTDEGYLSPAKAKQLSFPKVKKPDKDENSYAGPKGYLVRAVEQTLTEKMGYTKEEIHTLGLHIRTTLNKRMQREAVRAVEQTLPKKWPHQRANVGLVSVKPGEGDILSMYGGHNALKDYTNNVVDDKSQLGSSFKPYVLAAALQEGIGLRSRFNGDSPRTFRGNYEVGNSHDVSYGMVDLPAATKHSVNTAFVDLGLQTGIGNVIDVAAAAGLPEKNLQNNRDASLFLGTASVRPVTQAAGIATFAAGGVYAEPRLISEVRDAEGNLQVKVEPKTERAFSEDVAADVSYAMQQVTTPGGTGENAILAGRPTAGKTGTTQRNRSVWFVGYTPRLTTAVTIYNPDFKPLRDLPVYGTVSSGVPAEIWHAYMAPVMENKPVREFPKPAWVGDPLNPAPTNTPEPGPSSPGTPKPSISIPETPGPGTSTPETPEPPEPSDPETPEPPQPTSPDEPSTPPSDGGDGGDGGGDGGGDCGIFGCDNASSGQGARPPGDERGQGGGEAESARRD